MSGIIEDVMETLDKRDEPKKVRTRKTEPKKKVKKVTKKEQQIIEINNSIIIPDNYYLVNTEELFYNFIDHYKTYKTMHTEPFVFIDTETYGVNPFKDKIISIQIGFMDDTHYYIPVRPFKHELSKDIPTLPMDLVFNNLRPLLESDKWLVLANAKFDIHVLYNWANIDITFNVCWDTMIAGGLLNENHLKGLKEWYKNYALPDLVSRGIIEDETKTPTFKFGQLFDNIPYDEVPHRIAQYYGCHDTFMTKAVFEYQKRIFLDPAFNLGSVWKLFREVEMPLIPILTLAERRGVKLDGNFLSNEIGGALRKKLEDIEEQIFHYLGDTIVLQKTKQRQKNGIKYKEQIQVVEKLNVGSPAQLARKLYEEHGILEPVLEYDSKLKKEVPKFKTDRKTLSKNKSKHPVIPLILEYRGLSKLIEAFCNTLPKAAEETFDGRVHTSYNQLVRTGRMSSREPNLQQVPSKFYIIRYAFQADEGRMLASADFSQQELRWLAIYTQDPALLEVYQKGLDMHSRITCQIQGFNYEMFEQIRNYKGDSTVETQNNIKSIITKWQGTEDLEYAVAKYNTDYNVDYSSSHVTEELVDALASYFELRRKQTKSVVFGTVYGITEIGLADQLSISKEEAKELIDGFKAGLPGYLQWEAAVHKEVMKNGYVEDWLGRKRRFGEQILEAKSTETFQRRGWHWILEKVKRQACNFKIQGTSASQVKKAMVDLFYPKRPDGTICFDRDEWLEKGYKSKLEEYDVHIVLQIHDELLFDVPSDISWDALKEITSTMQNTIPTAHLGVEFKSDIEVAPYWGGKFSPEEVKKINSGELNWRAVFIKEVREKIEKELGREYEVGMFIEQDDEDDYETY